MKLIRFTINNSPNPCFGLVIRDQAVPFAVLQSKAGMTCPHLADSRSYLASLPDSERAARELLAWGEQHFGVQDIQDRELAMGPPPNPTGQMSDFGAVTTMCVISFPAGTEAPAHNAPQPYVVIVLSGEGEVATSDGESRRFHPGELLFCNELTGKGHVTRAVTDMTLAFVNRAHS